MEIMDFIFWNKAIHFQETTNRMHIQTFYRTYKFNYTIHTSNDNRNFLMQWPSLPGTICNYNKACLIDNAVNVSACCEHVAQSSLFKDLFFTDVFKYH